MPDTYTLDEALVQHLPLPLAQLYLRAYNAHTSLERHQGAYYLWEAGLKLLAAVAVVEYADLGEHRADLVECLTKLARPSLGHWWEFVGRLVPVLADTGDAGFGAARDLALGSRARDDMPRAAGLDAALLATLEGREGARSRVRLTELFERLVQYRNREIGHGAAGQRPGEFYEQMARVLLAGAAEVFGRLDVLAGRRLLYVGEVRRQASGHWLVERYALRGESAKRIESLELPEKAAAHLPTPERVYLEVPAGGKAPATPRLRALHPLVHFEAASGLVYFLNSRRGKRGIEYLSYGSGGMLRRDELGTEHRELLARVLGQPVGAEAAEAWAAVSLAADPVAPGAPAETTAHSIGEFELLSRLGHGGMGVVYRAWQPSLGRQVALKCMLRAGDPKAEARFAREIRALGRVEHPNVVKVFTSGSERDQWFYAMELIEGAELARVCDQLAGSSAAEIDGGHWRRALTTACEHARSQETQLSRSQSGISRPAAPTAPAAPAPPTRPGVPVGGRGHVMQVVDIVRQVAGAAHTLHEAGVVHRDIKPGNIMLTADASHPVLMDLGLAQLADETEGRLTSTRQFVGTLRYASPEQVLSAARVDRRTDIYSLGATLWELLTLRPLFGICEDTQTPDLMLRIQTTDPEKPRKYNRHVPRDLEAIVMKCLEKDRARRYATAADLAADLGRFLDGEPVSAQPPSMTYVAGKLVRRYRVALAVAAVVLAVLLGGAVAAFVGIDQQRRDALDAKGKLQEANGQLQGANDRLDQEAYRNRIAVAERELTMNQDIGLASSELEKCPQRLRGWEWDYLMRLREGGRPPLNGHQGGLWTALFSRDGSEIATASIDGTVKFWDARSGRELRTFKGHLLLGLRRIAPVTCLAYSPDGQHIASASLTPNLADPANARKAFGVVKVWDPRTLRETARYDRQIGLVYCLTYSPDGRRIATSHINDERAVAVWDAETGREVHVFRDIPCHTHRLRYSTDGRYLLAGCTDGMIRVWDAATFKPVRKLDAHSSAPVYDLAFCPPDGARFASSGVDGVVRVWETATFTPVLTLRGHTGAAMGVTFSPDRRRIASAGYDKTVRLWDADTGEEKITLRGHHDMVLSVDFSPDGRQLVSASFDKEARIWDASLAEEPTAPGLFKAVEHTDRVNTVAFSPDGRRIASGGYDRTVRLWDGATGRSLHTLRGHEGPVWGVAFSPDGRRLASASWDRTVKIWDTESGSELLTFARHGAPAHGVAFSPDGKTIASTSWEGLVKVWDPTDGREIRTYAGHLLPAMTVAFSPNGKLVASASGDRLIKVWEADSGRDVLTLKGHEALVHSVAFSPDGKRIASASWDGTAKVWDAKTGKAVTTFGEHHDRVQSVAFSPDGTRVASAGEDKTVRLWDAATGREVLPPGHHRGVVWAVAFSPDGKRVVTGCWSSSGWVRTWKAE
jgi:WD40 repeat protein/serine/threonine protein kinase